MAFQTTIGYNQAPAIEGDFATASARHNVNTVPGGFVADTTCIVGRFGWTDSSATDTKVTTANGTGAPRGFVGRQGLNSPILNFPGTGNTTASMQLLPGTMVVLYKTGDFFVRTSTNATIGQKVFANNTDGTASTAAAGATVGGSTETIFSVAAPALAGELIKMSPWGA